MTLLPEQIAAHNRFYAQAWKLIKGEVHIDGQPLLAPGWFVRRRLMKAKHIFEKSIAINSSGWSAMFAIGKIEQRLGNLKESLDWMLRAREFSPENTSLAKEASAMASQIGWHEMGARIADEAIALKPDDAALFVNSGLAHICSGHSEIALDRFCEAVRLEPHMEMNRKLKTYATKVLTGSLPVPRTESDILLAIKNC